MTTRNTFQNSFVVQCYSHLTCDICRSGNVVNTIGGFVCQDCGIVLEVKKFQYDRPYNNDIIQYAHGLGTTQIGTRRERAMSPNSMNLNRLNKHGMVKEYEHVVLDKARTEISRIFTCLDLADYDAVKRMVLDKFINVRAEIRPGSKYRNTEKLATIIIYYCLKLRSISINPIELITVSKLTKREFNDFNLQVQAYVPEYAERNRQNYILQRVMEISEHFELGMYFYYQAKKILHRLWEGIKDTTDNVIAGLVSSITTLCSYKEKISVNSICGRLGIRMSTIQSQVKRKIFTRFRVKGFVSLVKSSNLLRIVMESLGLMEVQGGKMHVKAIPPTERVEIIELVFGNSRRIFKRHEAVDYYFFAMRNETKFPTFISVKIHDKKKDLKWKISRKVQTNNLMDFEFLKYYKAKDPPIAEGSSRMPVKSVK